MFFPGAAVYMEKVAAGPEAGGRHRHHGLRPRRTSARVAKAKGRATRGDQRSRSSTGPGTPTSIAAVRSVGARVYLITRRRRRRRDRGRDATLRASICSRHRRNARGRDRRRGAEVPRRRDPGQAVARATTRNAHAWSTQGFDLDAVLTTDDLVSGDDVFFAATRHHRRNACCAACSYWPDGATTYSMVMRSRSGTVR